MGFWLWVLWVVSAVASVLLRPRPRIDSPQPSSLGDFNVPTADETRAIPVAMGTCLIEGANVVWYGDFVPHPYSVNDQLAGYHYALGIQYGLCMGPIDEILEVRFDGKVAPFASSPITDGERLNFNLPTFFGGDGAGGSGGVTGDIDLYYGTTTQVPDGYLESHIGVALPAYRRLCYAVLRHFYVGTSPFMRPIAFVVRGCPNQLGLTGGKHNIGGDANPAAMLYQLLTDTTWGMSIDPGKIDTTSFLEVGEALFNEGFGLSMLWDRASDADDLVNEILRHIDAVRYPDPETGLTRLKLIRADYTIGALPIFNDSNILDFKMQRASWPRTSNAVKVRYVDRANNFTERIASAQDLANIQIRNAVVTEDFSFLGISGAAIAQKVAARELMGLAFPAAPFELELNRDGWALRPGDAFRVTWTPLGITDMVCRVAQMKPGELLDGKIRVNVIEDIYGVAWTAYAPPGTTGWVDPLGPPSPLSAQRLLEAPYALAGGDRRRVMTLGVHAAGVYSGYEVWSDPAGGTAYAKTNTVTGLTPSGLLTADIGHLTTSLTVGAGGVDLQLLASISDADLALGKNLLLVDDELIAWKTVTVNLDGSRTLSGLVRGVADTTPRPHTSPARVWFPVSNGHGFTNTADYLIDLTVAAKLLPYNAVGVVAIASATAASHTTTSRASRPYVPTAVELNGEDYPDWIDGELDVSWLHRNRVAPWEYDDAGVTAAREPSTDYRVKVYGEAGTLIHTESGITGLGWTYLLATEISDGGLGRPNDELRVTVESYNTATSAISHQVFDHTVQRAGWGLRWGERWGG